jgi:hypothetical protein
MLRDAGAEANVVVVNDNNDIDREVTFFRPDIVIIEALWVVPEKFEVLTKLHPTVDWVVRIHSEIPFLAEEGIAIEWIEKYLEHEKVFVAFNSKRGFRDFSGIIDSDKLFYLPNYFPIADIPSHKRDIDGVINIGCFGAIRPFKNQLMQAMAAIRYADKEGKILFFHMNTSRVERGKSVLRNIRALFANSVHTLVEHDWFSHHKFKSLLSCMDLSMCVSFTETFCIVAADSVNVRIPLVCSSEVPWSSKMLSQADPEDMDSIVEAIDRVLSFPRLADRLNRRGLKEYNSKSVKIWKEFVE